MEGPEGVQAAAAAQRLLRSRDFFEKGSATFSSPEPEAEAALVAQGFTVSSREVSFENGTATKVEAGGTMLRDSIRPALCTGRVMQSGEHSPCRICPYADTSF